MIPHLRNCYINATGEMTAAIFLVVILISSLLRKKETPSKRPFCIMTAVLIALLTESGIAWALDGVALSYGSSPTLDAVRHGLIVLDYILYATIDDLFFLYLIASIQTNKTLTPRSLKRVTTLFWGMLCLGLLAGLAFAASLWTGWVFTIDAYGGMNVTPAYTLLTVIGACAQIASLLSILQNWHTLGSKKAIACLLYLIVPTGLIYVDVTYRLTTSYICCAFVIFTIYITVDLEQDRQLMEREADVARSEAEKIDMKVGLMMSQIQPHFLYNSLSSIAYLCRKDPKEAEIAVNEFADYLRMNLRSINNKQPILFETELSHSETYLKIQKRRFPEQLIVEYDIEATEFRIPALTLQPIVENAVKHAVETRFEPTTIRIAAKETEDSFLVTVEDDGPGFDTAAIPGDDRPHIGISSATTRLQNMVHGRMEISSTIGVGTTVRIIIPKQQEVQTK